MAANFIDIKGDALEAGDHVVFCQAGSSKLMTLGYISRVLAKTVEVTFTRWDRWKRQMVTDSVYRRPEEVVQIDPKEAPSE